jgi:hypothetical protein
MKLKNLNSVIDKYFGPFCEDSIREAFISAAKADFDKLSNKEIPSGNSVDKDWLIYKYNQVFNRKNRIISDAVLKKYKKVFENFTKAEIEMAMNAAKSDEFHASKGFRHCTLEYFSRIDQIDKWLNIAIEAQEKKQSSFVLPKFNIKED